jgi:hypothetical protein
MPGEKPPAVHQAEEWHWLYVFQSTVGQRIVKYRFEQDVIIRLVSAGISVAIGFQGEDQNTIRNSTRAGTIYPAVLQVGISTPQLVMYVSIPVSKGTDLYFNNTSASSTCDSYVAYTLR